MQSSALMPLCPCDLPASWLLGALPTASRSPSCFLGPGCPDPSPRIRSCSSWMEGRATPLAEVPVTVTETQPVRGSDLAPAPQSRAPSPSPQPRCPGPTGRPGAPGFSPAPRSSPSSAPAHGSLRPSLHWPPCDRRSAAGPSNVQTASRKKLESPATPATQK